MTAQIAEIKEAHAKERQESEKALRRSRAPNLGVFAGLAYSHSGEVRLVAGIGIVFKIIQ